MPLDLLEKRLFIHVQNAFGLLLLNVNLEFNKVDPFRNDFPVYFPDKTVYTGVMILYKLEFWPKTDFIFFRYERFSLKRFILFGMVDRG